MVEIAKAALKTIETPSSFNPDKILGSNKELTKNFNETGGNIQNK